MLIGGRVHCRQLRPLETWTSGSDVCGLDTASLQSHYDSGSQSGRYRPLGGGGITEVGANRYERWKGALLLSQGGASRQAVRLFL